MEKEEEQTNASKYYVVMTTMANVCQVQIETASPIGQRHLGPFDTREQATTAMCNDIDPAASDQAHCWVTIPANACNL